MSVSLENYIEQYIQLEIGTRELLQGKCGSLCARCTSVCCDVVMCVEAIKSPFLSRVHQQKDLFDEERGFISETGCKLEKGRPSVCYEYFCDNQFYFQPSDLHAEVLQILGALIHHATRNARGTTALEDVPSEEELERLDFAPLLERMKEASRALDIIRGFYRDGTLDAADHQILKTIHIPEEFIGPTESSAAH